LRRRVERCPGLAEEIVRQAIIRVQSHDELPSSDADPRVPRRCLATVLDVSDQADPGIARSLDEAFDIRMAGGIVDDDRLPSIDRLTEDAVDALLKKSRLRFITGDHDREPGRLRLLERTSRSGPSHGDRIGRLPVLGEARGPAP
jgi:hypothetical protein